MAFTCGFFNSQNGDRKYNAEQMASIFDGLIKDGVYDTVGDIFAVTPGTGMQVLVGSGRAWFDHTWNNNDAQYPLAITAADVSLPRYDAVVLETNHSDTVRTNRLRVLTGTPSSNPVKPTMASTANVKQHPLAYIKVTAGATAITQSMIQVVVGTSECPFVTGIIDTAQIDALFQQWNGEFNEWFENLKAQLSDNVVANLQGQIDQKVAKADVATTADIEAGTSTTKWVSPKGLKDFSKNVGVYDQTTGKSIKLQTGVGLVGVKHNMSPMPVSKTMPFWIYDKYIAYCGLKNTATSSNPNYGFFIRVLDAESNTEYFAKSISGVPGTSSLSDTDYFIDPVCNGMGFYLGKSNSHGAIYDHEKKTFTKSFMTGGLSGHSAYYQKYGFTKNFVFRYNKDNRCVDYTDRGTANSYKTLYLPSAPLSRPERYGTIYAGYVNDYIYLADVASTHYSGTVPIQIYKCDLSKQTSSMALTTSIGLNGAYIGLITVDDTNAYFVITDSSGTYSKVLAFNYKTETWNLDSVLSSNRLSITDNRCIYMGTIGDRVYFKKNSPVNILYFDKSDLQIYQTSIANPPYNYWDILGYNTHETKFNNKIFLYAYGYVDCNDLSYHDLYPVAIPTTGPQFRAAANSIPYMASPNFSAFGPVVRSDIVATTVFIGSPSSSPNYDYDTRYFGRIQPILLNNLA